MRARHTSLVALIRRLTLLVLFAGVGLFGQIARADIAPHDSDPPTRAVAPEESATAGSVPASAGAPAGEEAPAHAEVPHLRPKSLALQLLNFGVLLFILIKFGGPAIGKALVSRHEQLKAELAAAAEARTAALARLEEQERRLAALEQEIVEIRNGVKRDAEAEKGRLIALAEERARRIREETTFALDQQVKEAEVRLRREVGLAAVDLAEQMVRRNMDARDQQRLLDAFVNSPVGVTPPRSGN